MTIFGRKRLLDTIDDDAGGIRSPAPEPTDDRQAVPRTDPTPTQTEPVRTRQEEPQPPLGAPGSPGNADLSGQGGQTIAERTGLAPGSLLFKDPTFGDQQIRAGLHNTREFPTPPTTGGGRGGDLPFSPDRNGILNSLQAFGPPNADTARAWWDRFGSQLSGLGWGFSDHPVNPRLVTPDGKRVDIIQGGSRGGIAWQWLTGGGGGGSTSGFAGSGFAGSGGGAPNLPTGGFGVPASSGPAPPSSAGLVTDLGPDPFGPLIESILGDLAASEGATSFGQELQDLLSGVIERGGAAPNDTTDLQFESAREGLARAERTSQNALRDRLASRNLLSVSGIDQGPEVSSIGRVQQRLGEEFAGAVRDIFIEQSRQDDNRLTNALSLATGLASDQARSLLNVAVQAGREREVLSNIALGVLDRNMAWNMFLAEHGLNRAQVLAQIQQGNIALLLPLIQQFFGGAAQAAGGFIG